MYSATLFKLVITLTIAILVAGCGDTSEDDNTKKLMGGAVQGKALSLSGSVTTFAGISGTNSSADGIGSSAGFQFPEGITTDGTNLYVTDSANRTIRKIEIATGAVTTLAGSAAKFGEADGIGAAASFESPAGITTDGTNLYVADAGVHTIRKIVIASGVVTTMSGTTGRFGATDGIGTAARFNSPHSITTDGINLYVADTGNNTIRKIVIANGAVTTLAGTAGVNDAADGIGAAASFARPFGITTDGTNLYVADTYNCTIRKIVIASGAVTTLAGTVGAYDAADGIGAAAKFNQPYGITTDGTNLYVVDNSSYTIRSIVISTGVVTTIAGTRDKAGLFDGIGAAARFLWPKGITTDGSSLYIADTFNNSIRRLN